MLMLMQTIAKQSMEERRERRESREKVREEMLIFHSSSSSSSPSLSKSLSHCPFTHTETSISSCSTILSFVLHVSDFSIPGHEAVKGSPRELLDKLLILDDHGEGFITVPL